MISIRYARNLFLRAICVVYMFAFLSFYIQIPGLYGNNGVLPARLVLENSKYKTLSARIHYQPTLLWLAPYLGLDVQYMMDLLSLLGIFLAFTGFISQKFCTVPTLAGLWSLYFSLYQVGQKFMSSQWDGLLLEAGFLSLLVAPFLPGKRRGSKGTPSDSISFWLVKWLLFRYLLTTGVIKLLSNCPKWWNLTALKFHFESMVLPTPLSWYAHHLPIWVLKIAAVFANVCEIIVPFLFFAPIRAVRITGFTIQIILQIFIVLTGNFNFRDLLLVTLSVSLLDDQFFFGRKRSLGSKKWEWLNQILNVLIYGGIFYGVWIFWGLEFKNAELNAAITFTHEQFTNVVRQGIPVTILVGIASLGVTAARAVAAAATESNPGALSRIFSTISTVLYAAFAVLLFAASTVPLTSLHPATNTTVLPSLRTLHTRLHRLHVINHYDLFKRMSGVTGRPEIILEGSDHIDGPWIEYQFIYKPGNVNHSLPYVAPYAPRLDWEMWWAAQNTDYVKHPWLLALAHRLLHGQQEVLSLLDTSRCPTKAPRYVRASLYTYRYTLWSERHNNAWWKRERVRDYFPAYTSDTPALLDQLRTAGVYPGAGTPRVQPHPTWKSILDTIRKISATLEPSLLLWSVFTAGCAIIVSTTRHK